jgi:hypothetical protein
MFQDFRDSISQFVIVVQIQELSHGFAQFLGP